LKRSKKGLNSQASFLILSNLGMVNDHERH
jgi:hypothetical protein